MTEAEIEMGRLRAALWRAEQAAAQWQRYAEHLERRAALAREDAANPHMWRFDPGTDPIARWYVRGAD